MENLYLKNTKLKWNYRC